MIDVLQIHPGDNVGVAVRPLASGTAVRCGPVSFTLSQALPLGAKVALRPLKAGDKVVKFGEPIGSMTADAAVGDYIHTHNLESDYLHTYAEGELVGGSGQH